jgi:hypothetical protein
MSGSALSHPSGPGGPVFERSHSMQVFGLPERCCALWPSSLRRCEKTKAEAELPNEPEELSYPSPPST